MHANSVVFTLCVDKKMGGSSPYKKQEFFSDLPFEAFFFKLGDFELKGTLIHPVGGLNF